MQKKAIALHNAEIAYMMRSPPVHSFVNAIAFTDRLGKRSAIAVGVPMMKKCDEVKLDVRRPG